MRGYRDIVEQRIVPQLGDLRLTEINADEVTRATCPDRAEWLDRWLAACHQLVRSWD